jgi:YEATS domain-containing protein 4
MTLSQAFVYGTTAKWLGPDADPNHTHQWTVFVRGLENEDLSYILSSVSFHLHSSFAEPTRTINTPPYQITESGWGEFAIIITLHFHPSAALNDINITHQLKLFPGSNTPPTVGQPVISETYDELVFHHPTREFYNILIRGPLGRFESDALVLSSAREFAREEQEQLVKLVASANHIKARLDRERQRLFSVDQDITLLTNRI